MTTILIDERIAALETQGVEQHERLRAAQVEMDSARQALLMIDGALHENRYWRQLEQAAHESRLEEYEMRNGRTAAASTNELA